jgi:hypothetical protein
VHASDECFPTTPTDYCKKTCGTDCCNTDPNVVGFWWCPPSPVGICCPSLYGAIAVLGSTNQYPICCVPAVGYNGPLVNCDGNCCEGGQCATVTGAAFGPYPACQSTVDLCTSSTPCLSQRQKHPITSSSCKIYSCKV